MRSLLRYRLPLSLVRGSSMVVEDAVDKQMRFVG